MPVDKMPVDKMPAKIAPADKMPAPENFFNQFSFTVNPKI